MLSIAVMGAALVSLAAPSPAAPSADRVAEVEADWATQEKVRGPGAAPTRRRRGNVTTGQDAIGAVDGVKNGKWGFHTLNEARPWWQVDLGKAQALSHALIYNRCDPCGQRNTRLLYLLSDDGKTWRKAYQHGGTIFWGFTDKKPLRVDFAGAKARFLRIQHPGTAYLHLDEVEVYAAAARDKNIAYGRACDQSSVSEWSVRHGKPAPVAKPAPVVPDGSLRALLERGRKLADDQARLGADVSAARRAFDEVAREAGGMATPAGDGHG